jgi:DNA-binding transcriptional ArsR family regulator
MSTDERLSPDVLEQATQTLRVLTHPHRLQICEELLNSEQSVGHLAQVLGLRPNVVSQHLNHLRAHRIVAPRRAGRAVYYEVVHPGPAWLLACIRNHMTPASDSELRPASSTAAE